MLGIGTIPKQESLPVEFFSEKLNEVHQKETTYKQELFGLYKY